MSISTHILDVSCGKPATDVSITLDVKINDVWQKIGEKVTNDDGRVASFGDFEVIASTYRLTFATSEYFTSQKVSSFFPEVQIVFEVINVNQHYHVPLLLSPFGYSTYRGS